MRSALAALLPLLALCGCAGVGAPADFLDVDAPARQTKAVAADDSLFWYREFRDGDRGDLAFWSGALKTEFIDRRGYTLVGESAAELAGEPSLELTFDVTVGGIARRYLMALAVDEGWLWNGVHVAEYLATREAFDAHREAVGRALRGE